MNFKFTNLTQSCVNIPDIPGKDPRYMGIMPGASVVVPQSYVDEICANENSRERLMRVTAQQDPIFSVQQTREDEPGKPVQELPVIPAEPVVTEPVTAEPKKTKDK